MASVTLDLSNLANLPPTCVCCGEPADDSKEHSFTSYSVALPLLLVVGLVFDCLIWSSRTLTLSLPVCRFHARQGWRAFARFLMGAVVAAGLGYIAHAVYDQYDAAWGTYLWYAALGTLVVAVVVGVGTADNGVRAKILTDRFAKLKGISAAFADGVRERRGAVPGGGSAGVMELQTAKYYRG